MMASFQEVCDKHFVRDGADVLLFTTLYRGAESVVNSWDKSVLGSFSCVHEDVVWRYLGERGTALSNAGLPVSSYEFNLAVAGARNRDSLGSFAAPYDMAVYGEVYNLITLYRTMKRRARKAVFGYIDQDDAFFTHFKFLADATSDETHRISLLNAQIESAFWWMDSSGEHGDVFFDEAKRHLAASSYSVSMFSRLSLVRLYPELHDYFSAGIWDVATARELVSQDIDAVLAMNAF